MKKMISSLLIAATIVVLGMLNANDVYAYEISSSGVYIMNKSDGFWVQDATGWWWNMNGGYIYDEWTVIDTDTNGNDDGIYYTYLFDKNGYVVTSKEVNGKVIDGDGYVHYKDNLEYMKFSRDADGTFHELRQNQNTNTKQQTDQSVDYGQQYQTIANYYNMIEAQKKRRAQLEALGYSPIQIVTIMQNEGYYNYK